MGRKLLYLDPIEYSNLDVSQEDPLLIIVEEGIRNPQGDIEVIDTGHSRLMPELRVFTEDMQNNYLLNPLEAAITLDGPKNIRTEMTYSYKITSFDSTKEYNVYTDHDDMDVSITDGFLSLALYSGDPGLYAFRITDGYGERTFQVNLLEPTAITPDPGLTIVDCLITDVFNLDFGEFESSDPLESHERTDFKLSFISGLHPTDGNWDASASFYKNNIVPITLGSELTNASLTTLQFTPITDYRSRENMVMNLQTSYVGDNGKSRNSNIEYRIKSSSNMLTARISADGLFPWSSFGFRTALSKDGSTLVVLSLGDSGYIVNKVHVYEKISGSWVLSFSTYNENWLIGSNLPNYSPKKNVVISSDGSEILFHASSDDNQIRRIVKNSGIFSNASSIPTQYPGQTSYQFGASLSLSEDGLTLVTSSHGHSSNIGKVLIYTKIEDNWTLLQVIDSPYLTEENFGHLTHISPDGEYVFATTSAYNSNNSEYSGNVIVYKKDVSNYTYNSTIECTERHPEGNWIFDIDSNQDASRLVISFGLTVTYRVDDSYAQSFYKVKTYNRDTPSTWSLHQVIDPPNYTFNKSTFGFQTKLNSDGQTLAVSSWAVNNTHRGMVMIYNLEEGNYTYKYPIFPVQNKPNSTRFGHTLSITGDALTLAVGFPGDDHPDSTPDTGCVYIYDLSEQPQ